MQNGLKFSVAATFEKANTYVLPKYVIHNKPAGPQMARLGYRCDYGGCRIGNVCDNVGTASGRIDLMIEMT